MPIYEYSCPACGHGWEEIQKITDRPLRTCRECGARRAKRLVSQTSFVLKGAGWYVTDYGRGTGGRAGESRKKTEASSETKSETKSEASTETKKDAGPSKPTT